MATTSTTFLFPPLELKKAEVSNLNYDRICFQFSVGKNNECTLIGYRMNAERRCDLRPGLIVLTIDKSSKRRTIVIKRKALFVQLELTVVQMRLALAVPGTHLKFVPEKKTIQGYSYVIYHLATLTAGGDLQTSPCPPAIPPGSGGGQG